MIKSQRRCCVYDSMRTLVLSRTKLSPSSDSNVAFLHHSQLGMRAGALDIIDCKVVIAKHPRIPRALGDKVDGGLSARRDGEMEPPRLPVSRVIIVLREPIAEVIPFLGIVLISAHVVDKRLVLARVRVRPRVCDHLVPLEVVCARDDGPGAALDRLVHLEDLGVGGRDGNVAGPGVGLHAVEALAVVAGPLDEGPDAGVRVVNPGGQAAVFEAAVVEGVEDGDVRAADGVRSGEGREVGAVVDGSWGA